MTRVPHEDLDCDEAFEHLHEFLRQQLTPGLATRIREHLERCRPCLSRARFERRYLDLLETAIRSEECPTEIRDRILEALKALPDPA